MGTDTADQNPVAVTSDHVDALLEAARYDDLDDVMSLASAGVSLDSKDSEGRTALHMASANGNIGIVNYLIRNGAKRGNRLDRDEFHRVTEVVVEIGTGREGGKTILRADVNASNAENNTPLHWACLNGHIEVVKILIQAGADVSTLNRHERTPVDEAAGGGKMDVIDAINTAVAEVELTRTSVS